MNGFRQAVELVTRVLVDENARVLTEAPTYNGVIGVLKSRMARIGAVDLDAQGMNPDVLEREIIKERPALVYCVPTYQNPTGINMPMERRREVLRVCSKYRVPLLEDGFNEELRFRGESYPTLKAMDSEGVVIYAGSFSKVLFPRPEDRLGTRARAGVSLPAQRKVQSGHTHIDGDTGGAVRVPAARLSGAPP